MTPATDGPQHVRNRLLPLARPVVLAAPEHQRPAGSITTRSAVIALVVLGIGLRVVPLVQNRNLWIDEAMLALNLVDRSPRQLLEPLDWNQGAPVGFLLVVKAAIVVLGPGEWALRLVPFVGSVLGLVGFAWLSRRLLSPPEAVVAVGLFAIAPYLISYTAECKQYGTDAALTIGLFAVALGLLRQSPLPHPSPGGGVATPPSLAGKGDGESGLSANVRRWGVLAACGAAAVWFSHPAVFVLGGLGIALFSDAVLRRDRGRIVACCATIACWLASFGACYLVSLRRLGGNQYLLDYWAGHFLPLPPGLSGDMTWLFEHFFGFFASPGGLAGTEIKAGGVAAVLSVVGLVAIGRKRWPVAVALVVPGLLALLASGLHKYPFAGRLLLFLVPLMLLTVARGAWVVTEALRPSQPLAAWLFLGLLFAAPALELYQEIRRPMRYEQLAPLLADVRARWQPGDRMYVYWGGVPAFTFYTRDDPFPPGVTLGSEHRDGRTAFRDELAGLAGNPRVWVVFSHRHQSEESLVRAYAEGLGRCEQEIHHPGANAFLFHFGRHR
jgi:hypothetical protein